MIRNKHGLPRTIPEFIKREVRQRCGFGCAICAVTIYEYEHFYPDFAHATSHNANSIVLLCPNCHSKVTKGLIPKSEVARKSERPASRKRGFSSENLPYFLGVPSLKLGGGNLIENTPVPIMVGKVKLIEFAAPEPESNVARVSISLPSANGKSILNVINNEWRVPSDLFDFEWVGRRFIFRERKNTPILIMKLEPPSFIEIELLRTNINGTPVHIDSHAMRIGGLTCTGIVASHCAVGIVF